MLIRWTARLTSAEPLCSSSTHSILHLVCVPSKKGCVEVFFFGSPDIAGWSFHNHPLCHQRSGFAQRWLSVPSVGFALGTMYMVTISVHTACPGLGQFGPPTRLDQEIRGPSQHARTLSVPRLLTECGSPPIDSTPSSSHRQVLPWCAQIAEL